ncbi:MAG: hypothetical protein ACR2NT_02025 [Acidimicrobiia bacterium]
MLYEFGFSPIPDPQVIGASSCESTPQGSCAVRPVPPSHRARKVSFGSVEKIVIGVDEPRPEVDVMFESIVVLSHPFVVLFVEQIDEFGRIIARYLLRRDQAGNIRREHKQRLTLARLEETPLCDKAGCRVAQPSEQPAAVHPASIFVL